MAARTTDPILVVGAGPTGLSSAIELCRHDLPCRIIEQNPAPSATSKALGIHSRTLEVFERMGILDPFLAAGKKIHGVNVYSGRDRIVHVTFDSLDAPYPFLLMLPQSETERILIDQLERRGVRVERERKLVGLNARSEAVDVELCDLPTQKIERASYPWLIGADGCHSTVRKALHLPFEGRPFDEDFMLADATIDWPLPSDEAHTFLSPEGIIACLPLTGEHRFRVIVDLPDSLPPPSVLDDMDACLPLFQAWMEKRGRPGFAKISALTWVSHFRIQSRIVPSYRTGRVFIAGDAGHVHSPVGGQGMNTGIQDAFNLVWKLALVTRGRAPDGLLDSYYAERHPIAAATVKTTELATRLVTLRGAVSREIRNHLARFLTSLDAVQAHGTRTASGLANNYKASPIVGEHRTSVLGAVLRRDPSSEEPSVSDWLDFGSAPHPGERAPDVEYMPGNRLYEILRGTKHTLLLFDGAAPTPEGYESLRKILEATERWYGDEVEARIVLPRRDVPDRLLGLEDRLLFDAHGLLHGRYGAGSECLYLVRPDGYVGFRAMPADGQALADYLSRFFVS